MYLSSLSKTNINYALTVPFVSLLFCRAVRSTGESISLKRSRKALLPFAPTSRRFLSSSPVTPSTTSPPWTAPSGGRCVRARERLPACDPFKLTTLAPSLGGRLRVFGGKSLGKLGCHALTSELTQIRTEYGARPHLRRTSPNNPLSIC